MEYAAYLIDFILHVDRHLATFVQDYGAWVYALLFLIIFVETGLVVMPFLPGDSLLFVVGALCGAGLMSLPLAMLLLSIAANRRRPDQLHHRPQCSGRRYSAGRIRAGSTARPSTARMPSMKSTAAITIVVARFAPFLRTFAPFVAGVGEMTRSKFTVYNVGGGLLWVCGLTGAGYLFGNLPWVKSNLSMIIWGMILVPRPAGAVRRLEVQPQQAGGGLTGGTPATPFRGRRR